MQMQYILLLQFFHICNVFKDFKAYNNKLTRLSFVKLLEKSADVTMTVRAEKRMLKYVSLKIKCLCN